MTATRNSIRYIYKHNTTVRTPYSNTRQTTVQSYILLVQRRATYYMYHCSLSAVVRSMENKTWFEITLPRNPSNERLVAFPNQPTTVSNDTANATSHLGIRPHDQLAQLVHHQDTKRKGERQAPEHARDGSHVEDRLEPRSVKVDHRDCGRGEHTARYD